MVDILLFLVVLLLGIGLTVKFYLWIRQKRRTSEDNPYELRTDDDFEEWSRAVQEDMATIGEDFQTVAQDFPIDPFVKYEEAKKTRTHVRKAVTKKLTAKKTAKKAPKKTAKKVTRG